ncbi:MAG: WxcM-like domain-containing protein [Candidatus Levybacteria bacterium]|nr:WxcM-like domain-containing protein [Candidatus Levybacteria bacterium]MBI2189916.1 WxcM-like domain-containing protein [Candidatus Levybacteria bacterium]MBI3069851.1 WxcM-like domain-containing protein [Candidatus Levybacteria bacterium]
MGIGKVEDAKKVLTFDLAGKENGSLTELYKDGEKTVVYLTATKPGGFKGYHLHRVRATRYTCMRGKVKIILYRPGDSSSREEHILDAQRPQRLFIPNDIATGLQNIGEEEVWLINYPDPPYDPNLKDEQVEYTLEELEKGVVK